MLGSLRAADLSYAVDGESPAAVPAVDNLGTRTDYRYNSLYVVEGSTMYSGHSGHLIFPAAGGYCCNYFERARVLVVLGEFSTCGLVSG